MRVKIEMEVETPDYDGRQFQQEVENFLLRVDPDSRLTAFKIQVKNDPYPKFDYRSVDWRE